MWYIFDGNKKVSEGFESEKDAKIELMINSKYETGKSYTIDKK